jgi:glycosyltransferase involved in cell wall biosynthesis
MRILMTTDTVGGVWNFTCELAQGLLAEGAAVCLGSLGRSPDVGQRRWASERKREWGANFHYEPLDAPLEWMEENDCAYSGPAPSLLQLIHEFRVDLLHSSQFCFGALPVGIPKIVTAHSDVYSWAECCRGGILEDSSWLRRYTKMVAHGLAAADWVVTPTRWMADALSRNFALPRPPVVLANGRSLPAAGTALPRRLQAVTAGRLWDEAKNISLLAEIRAPLPILVAGEAGLGRSSTAASLGDAISLGVLSPAALLDLFRQSAVYICTSVYEPFGLAPLEAGLSGCAVLASDIPSLREVWRSGALYFQDAASLAELLQKLCGEPRDLAAAQLRSACRARRFPAERMVCGYRRLFEQALFRGLPALREQAIYAT